VVHDPPDSERQDPDGSAFRAMQNGPCKHLQSLVNAFQAGFGAGQSHVVKQLKRRS
jgi:hypothetical protein